ncbi:MAG: hypothetical protein ACLUOI_39160 [Eisenbergiella sp.]
MPLKAKWLRDVSEPMNSDSSLPMIVTAIIKTEKTSNAISSRFLLLCSSWWNCSIDEAMMHIVIIVCEDG